MIAFVHIPKTAGTTLHKILVHQAGPGGVVVRHDGDGIPSDEWLATVRKRDRLGGLLVVGHQSVGIHKLIENTRYVTCVREPVSRLLSHYQHAYHDPNHYLHRAIHDRNLDPGSYVASGLSGELSNGMVRMFAGVEDFHTAPVDESTLEAAKENLANLFDAVIPSERFDEGVLLLARKMGWPTPFYLRRKVGAGRKPGLDARTIRNIRLHNQLDVDLYDWVLGRFEQDVGGCLGLEWDLRRFRRMNRFSGLFFYGIRELRHRLNDHLGASLVP